MARKMKDSGIEWIKEIPADWETSKVKYELECKDELREPISAERRERNNPQYDYYGASGVIDKIDSYNVDDEVLLIGEDGANLVMRNLPLIYKAKGKFWVNNHAHILKPYKQNDYDYLYYLLEMGDYTDYITGSAQPKLSQSKLMSFYILKVPLAEQKIIVDYLNEKCGKIDTLLADIQTQINLLEDYKKSVITEAVTKGLNPDVEMKDSGIEWIGEIPKNWKVLRVKNIGEYRNGLTYSPLDLTDENEGTIVLRSSNVKNGKIVFEDNVYVSCAIRPDLKVKQGDILICSRNGSRDLVGKNAIVRDNIEASFGAFMMIFRCSCPKYMYYVLNSSIFSYYLGTFFTSTINQLTGNNFGNMKIVFCDNKVEQNIIVEYLDKKCAEIDGAIKEKKEQLEVLEQYKKSLIYEYVTGKKEVLVND